MSTSAAGPAASASSLPDAHRLRVRRAFSNEPSAATEASAGGNSTCPTLNQARSRMHPSGVSYDGSTSPILGSADADRSRVLQRVARKLAEEKDLTASKLATLKKELETTISKDKMQLASLLESVATLEQRLAAQAASLSQSQALLQAEKDKALEESKLAAAQIETLTLETVRLGKLLNEEQREHQVTLTALEEAGASRSAAPPVSSEASMALARELAQITNELEDERETTELLRAEIAQLKANDPAESSGDDARVRELQAEVDALKLAQATAAPAAIAMGHELVNLTNELEDERVVTEELRARVAELEAAHAAAPPLSPAPDTVALSNELIQMTNELEDERAVTEELKARNATLESELQEAKSAQASVSAAAMAATNQELLTLTNELEEARAASEELKARTATLESELLEAKAAQSQTSVSAAAMAATTQELLNLTNELEDERAVTEELKIKVAALEQEVAELKTESAATAELSGATAELRAEAAALESELAALRSAHTSLEHDLEDEREVNAALTAKLTALEGAQAAALSASASTERAQLLDEERAANAELRTRQASLESELAALHESHKEEVQRLRAAAANEEESHETIAALREEVSSTRKELDAAVFEKDRLRAELEETARGHAQELEEATAPLEGLGAKLSETLAELERVKRDLLDAQAKEASLQSELDAAVLPMTTLGERLNVANDELKEERAQNQKLRSRVDELEQAAATPVASSAASAATHDEVDKLLLQKYEQDAQLQREEAEALVQQVAKLGKKCNEEQRKLAAAQAEIETLKKRLERAQKDVDVATQPSIALGGQLISATEELQALKKRNAELMRELEHRDALAREVEELRADIADEVARREDAERRLMLEETGV